MSESKPHAKGRLTVISNHLLRNCYWNRSNFADVLNEVLLSFERINLYSRLPKWEEDIKNSQKFLCFYAKQFKTILIFTQSTQESDTELHLLVTKEFIKYFFWPWSFQLCPLANNMLCIHARVWKNIDGRMAWVYK